MENKKMFLNLWSNTEDVARDFAICESELEGVEILFASYEYEDYSGNAFVLFRKNGKLYEVNAGHCSCYGLEGQWYPEETNLEAIKFRLDASEYSFDHCRSELKEYVEQYERK